MPQHYHPQMAVFEPARCAVARFLLWSTLKLHQHLTMRLLPKHHPSRVFFERQLKTRPTLIKSTVPSTRDSRVLTTFESNTMALASLTAAWVALLAATPY